LHCSHYKKKVLKETLVTCLPFCPRPALLTHKHEILDRRKWETTSKLIKRDYFLYWLFWRLLYPINIYASQLSFMTFEGGTSFQGTYKSLYCCGCRYSKSISSRASQQLLYKALNQFSTCSHIPCILYFKKSYFELKKLHIFLGLEEPHKSTINNKWLLFIIFIGQP
jgi:hypothetical protein